MQIVQKNDDGSELVLFDSANVDQKTIVDEAKDVESFVEKTEAAAQG